MVDVEGRLPKTQVTMSIDELIDSCEKGEAMDDHGSGSDLIKGRADYEVMKCCTFFPGDPYTDALDRF